MGQRFHFSTNPHKKVHWHKPEEKDMTSPVIYQGERIVDFSDIDLSSVFKQ